MSYAERLLRGWAQENKLRAAGMKDDSAFDRNLEAWLDGRRQANYILGFKPEITEDVADFTTGDFLGMARSRKLRDAYLAELAAYPDFPMGSLGSRVQDGNYDYLNTVEQEIADFHGAEACYITTAGFTANVGVLSGVLLPGDAIVYDTLVHASSIEGIHLSLAGHKLPFKHNDPDDLREVLANLKKNASFKSGKRSILIVVESVYSMDGDVCPLRDFVRIAKEEYPLGNAQFVIDEAHSLGIFGDRGMGLVNLLGLESDIAIRVHVGSKSLGAGGGEIPRD